MSLVNTITNERRLEALQAAGWKCQRCGEQGSPDAEGTFSGMEVHHKDGKHLTPYDHRDANLEVLCGPCHDKAHGRRPRAKSYQRGTNRILWYCGACQRFGSFKGANQPVYVKRVGRFCPTPECARPVLCETQARLSKRGPDWIKKALEPSPDA